MENATSQKTRDVNFTSYERVSRPETLTGRDIERFWAKVQKADGDGCWLWTGSRGTRGYGQFFAKGAPRGAHRVAYALSHGPIPADAYVLHSCDTPACCKPAHLSTGDQFDNMRGATDRGRLRLPRRRTRAVVPVVIRRYLAGGVTMRQLAAEYGISHITVGRWLKPHKQPHARADGATSLRRSA